MDNELNESKEYLDQIIDASGTIATRMIDEFSRDHLEMFEKIVFFMESRNQNQEAIYIAQALLDRHSENGKIFLLDSFIS